MSRRVVERSVPGSGARVEEALEAIASGRPILLAHEGEGRTYFVAAAERATEELVVAAAVHGRGVLKVALTPERIAELDVPPLAGTDLYGPVDVHGAERSGSASDRLVTMRALVERDLVGDDLLVPGHVFLMAAGDCDQMDTACVGRVAIEAMLLAGCAPVAAFCEAADEHGSPLDGTAAAHLAGALGLELVSLREMTIHRERTEPSVARAVQATIPTPDGPLTAIGYVGTRRGDEYVAFCAGVEHEIVRVHIHRRCMVSDVFGGVACGCGEEMRSILDEMHRTGNGVVVYYGEQSEAFCPGRAADEKATWPFTAEVAAILHELGASRVVLTSNGPLEVDDLRALGIDIAAG